MAERQRPPSERPSAAGAERMVCRLRWRSRGAKESAPRRVRSSASRPSGKGTGSPIWPRRAERVPGGTPRTGRSVPRNSGKVVPNVRSPPLRMESTRDALAEPQIDADNDAQIRVEHEQASESGKRRGSTSSTANGLHGFFSETAMARRCFSSATTLTVLTALTPTSLTNFSIRSFLAGLCPSTASAAPRHRTCPPARRRGSPRWRPGRLLSACPPRAT